MEPVAPPPDAERIVSGIGVLAGLDRAGMDAVLGSVEWLGVRAGERVFSVGDEPDGMYVIAAGRVRFFTEDDGAAMATAEVGEGVCFGEGSLLSGAGRSRSAVVVRDAVLGRLPPGQFQTLLSTSPALATSIARRLATRIAFEEQTRDQVPSVDHTVIVADGVDAEAVRWLAVELGRQTGAAVLTTCDPCAPAPSIVVTVPAHGELPAICRHAGRVMVVVPAADAPGRLPPIQPALEQMDPLARPVTDLVLLRSPGDHRPSRTKEWISRHEPADHFFVTSGRVADIERLGRHLGSRAVGLVLGGGGARGMAHIGVLRALAELGIPVDVVGGSSVGAVIGAQLSLGWSWEEMVERNRVGWARILRPLDITLPTVSISSGRAIRRLLDGWFAGTQIEDLQLPYFCTSVNLSRFRLEVHRSGPAAQWIRASCSAPGLWPPVVDDDGELHVDGGQLNNVPTDVMRLQHRGLVLAVDVASAQSAMTVPRGTTPRVGVRHLVRRRARARFPSLVDTFGRCALLGSLQQREQAAAHADVYLAPDCSSVSFTGFKRIDQAIDIGYRTALEALGDLDLTAAADAARA